LDPTLNSAYTLAMEKAGLSSDESWAQGVDLFIMLFGTDLYGPKCDATFKLTCGEAKQGRAQLVLDYSAQLKSTVLAASPILPASVICDKFVSGLSHPSLRHECMFPLHGGRWDDLHACIMFVIAAEKRLSSKLSTNGSGSANAVQASVQEIPAYTGSAESDGDSDGSANVMRFNSHQRCGKKKLFHCRTPSHSQGPALSHSCHQIGHIQRGCLQCKRIKMTRSVALVATRAGAEVSTATSTRT